MTVKTGDPNAFPQNGKFLIIPKIHGFVILITSIPLTWLFGFFFNIFLVNGYNVNILTNKGASVNYSSK